MDEGAQTRPEGVGSAAGVAGGGGAGGSGLGAFRRVMACVGVSPSAGLVVREAARLARSCGSELTFLHAGSERERVVEIVREGARDEPMLGSVEVIGREGTPDRVILEEARRIDADLVFAGALKSDPLFTGIVGSVARRLARNADRSLFLSIHRFPPEGVARTIVASVMFDDRSRAMVEAAARLAIGAGARELHVVREYDPYSARMSETTGAAGADSERWEHVQQTATRFELANFLEECARRLGVADGAGALERSGVALRTECMAGRGGEEAARYAERVGADLLVMPAPDRRLGVLDRFFGHPTETLLEQFPCSVLLFRRLKKGEAAPGVGT
ncbi:MAG: universal stress protein [Phycisphaeraceae bacterium]|nr:universal stress protein [Phycisphaeraceae bacterium]